MIEADPVAAAVRAFMSARTEWTGTASDLLGALAEVVDERIAKSKTWPDSPRALSGRLRRAATFLRKIGIEVAFKKEGRARTRIVHITASAPENAGAQPSAPSARSASSRQMPHTSLTSRLSRLRTVAGNANGSDAATVRVNRLEINPGSAADGADAKSPSNLRPEEPERLAGGGGYECGSCAQVGTCRWHSRAYRWRRPGT